MKQAKKITSNTHIRAHNISSHATVNTTHYYLYSGSIHIFYCRFLCFSLIVLIIGKHPENSVDDDDEEEEEELDETEFIVEKILDRKVVNGK